MVLIAVHGAASRFLPAERGTVHLTVELEHEDRATVMQQVAALHERFSAEAEAFVASDAATWWGSDQLWVRTDHRFEHTDENRVVVQIATARIHVRFRDFAVLSTWLLEAGAVPGIRVERIDWAVTREHERSAARELRVEAVGDAVARAEAYASAIGGTGVTLHAVWEAGLRPSTSGSEGRAQLMSAFGRRGAEPGIALRPEDIEIAAEVTADFLVDA